MSVDNGAARMTVLVTGAGGFIGRFVVAALVAAGHAVVAATRPGTLVSLPGIAGQVDCDFVRDLDASDWQPRLDGIDAVVNCVGILREARRGDFSRVHHLAPRALFQACVASGIRRVVQISALGHPDDGEFVASKHALDEDLAGLDLEWAALRPSLVYSVHGSYGGTSLLRAMAAMPGLLPLPDRGQQPLQPIAAEDLGRAVVSLLEGAVAPRAVLDAVGPEVMPLSAYLGAWRSWLRLPPARLVSVPTAMIRPIAAVADRTTRGPFGRTMLRMLERGNATTPADAQRFFDAVGFVPQPLESALASQPSSVQHRWHARLYLLRPLMLLALAALWMASGVVGLMLPENVSATLLAPLGLGPRELRLLVLGTSALDLAIGAAVLVPALSRHALAVMLVMLAGYTVGLGFLHPPLWLDPAGGLLKNLALLPMVLALLFTAERR